MLDSEFEAAFTDCLRRQRDFYLFFRDVKENEFDATFMVINTIAPQHSVSTFQYDAQTDEISLLEIAKDLGDKAKNIVSPEKYSEFSGGIDQIIFSCSLLLDSMIVIHNAHAMSPAMLVKLQQLLDLVATSGSSGRLRVVAIGDVGLLHAALQAHLKFINLKFYNLMDNRASMDALLSKVSSMTVGQRLFDFKSETSIDSIKDS